MRIESVTSGLTNEIRKTDAIRRNEKADKVKPSAKSDSLSFSASAQRLSDTKAAADIVSARLAVEPDVRLDRVETVKQRIKEGYYNSEEFTDKLADKLMSDFGLGKVS